MKRIILNTIFLFTLHAVYGQVPMTSLLTIEQGVINVNSFEFWLEKGNVRSQYFKYDKFSSQRIGSFYSNTNLFAFTDRSIPNGKYILNIILITPDSTYRHQTDVDLNEDIIGASVVSLIGKSKSGFTYLKDLSVVRHKKTDKEFLHLKPVFKPEINSSPVFEIIGPKIPAMDWMGSNKYNVMPVYPYNHYGHFYGRVDKETNGEWKTYGYVQPYQNFTCEPEYKISADSTIKCYFSTKEDCSRNLIDAAGEYKFEIDVGMDEMESRVPEKFVEAGTLRLRKFEYYTLEYKFKIDK